MRSGLCLESAAMTFDQVIEHFGRNRGRPPSGRTAAQKLGLTGQAVNRWRRAGIPRWWQQIIERRTRGKLKAS